MRTLAATAFVLLLLSGCSAPVAGPTTSELPPSPAPPPPPSPASPPPPTLSYGCPGSLSPPQPCLAPWRSTPDADGDAYAIVPDLNDPRRVAILLNSDKPVGTEAPQPEAPAFLAGRQGLAVSRDGGASWESRLVPHGVSDLPPPVSLTHSDGVWTADGSLILAGYLEDQLFGIGRLWIGRSTDEGASWQVAALLPDGNWLPDVAQGPDGLLVVTWSTSRGGLRAVWSMDDGQTWSRIAKADRCDSPRIAWAGGQAFISCQIWETFESHNRVPVYSLSIHQDEPLGLAGVVDDTDREESCHSSLVTALADGRLAAARFCDTLQLWMSEDGAGHWSPFGDEEFQAWPDGASDFYGPWFAAGPNGTLHAVSWFYYPTVFCCIVAKLFLSSWDSEGRLLATSEVASWTDAAGLPFFTDLQPGLDRLWLLGGYAGDSVGSLNRLGWIFAKRGST